MTSQIGRRLNNVGFTLLETTVVIVIILLILVGSVPYFGKFFGTMGLNTAARDISTVLKTARSYAITERKVYNVIFDTSIIPNRYYIADNSEQLKQKGKGHTLPTGITISKITFSLDGNKYKASFKANGALSTTETTSTSKSVWIRKANESNYSTNPVNFKRITVDNVMGRVKIDEEMPSS